MSVLRIMLFMLAAKITNQIQYFKSRVSADLGLFESESCIEAQLNTINNQNLLDSASLIVTPNAYKTNKLYSAVPFDATGDMAFIRATSATRVNAQGLIETVGLNIPRIDYSDSSCPSILVEPQRTNLLVRSEEFENGSWYKPRCTVLQNVATAPNGTSTADYIIEDNTTGLRYVGLIGMSTTIGTTWTFSFFCKKVDRSVIAFQISEGGTLWAFARFNFDTNKFIDSPANMNCSFVLHANGWYRLIFTRTPTNGTSSNFAIFPTDENGNINGVGNGVSKTLLWGAQLEVGANATSYIPTTTAAVTRNADVISKTDATTLIGQTEGTIYVDFDRTKVVESLKNISYMYSSFLTEGIAINVANNLISQSALQIFTGGYTYTRNFLTLEGKNKIAVIYSTTQTKIFLNGVQLTPLTNAGIPAMNTLDINNRVGGRQSGPFRTFALWKSQITDVQAIQLTTL